ncbi:anti-sigma factor family protein [Oceanibacterium hippocampi]|uniref:Transmembrane transcriptional regulator (Anti-sigma factor) n=1 Tax=Oceanibacterium hippocampi TaxID=745714 RepID=A0A1Y5TUZ5_9PROT|nr:hypothetical protein [Oceanibacterium hippocampi]SLN73754.1 hypothetical protein OCH7691_03654 [Oceanibacterium hippocampi]
MKFNWRSNYDLKTLQDYVDGRLDTRARLEVERHLLTDANDAAIVASYRRQNAALSELDDDVLNEAVPERFLEALRRAGEAKSAGNNGDGASEDDPAASRRSGLLPISRYWPYSTLHSIALLAAAFAIAAVSALAAWLVRGEIEAANWERLAQRQFVGQAIASFSDGVTARLPGSIRGLGGRDGSIAIVPPRLDSAGFAFRGGRRMSGIAGDAFEADYADTAGRRLMLFARRADRPAQPPDVPGFPMARAEDFDGYSIVRGNTRAVLWQTGTHFFVLVSTLPENEASRIARLIAEQAGG